MPTVLYVAEYGTLNGGENSLLSTLPHLQELGWDCVVSGPANSDLAHRVKTSACRFFDLKISAEIGRRPLENIRQDLLGLIKKVQPHLVHGNSLSVSRILGALAPDTWDQRTPDSIPATPLIGHIRDMMKISKKAARNLNKLACLVTVSRATADWYEKLGVAGAGIRVIHNGVDLDQFRPRSATGFLHAEFGIPTDKPIILTVGQIGMRKGLDIAARALAEIAARQIDFDWVVVGERHSSKDEAVDYEQQLLECVDSSSLHGRVHFLGRRNDMEKLMNEATLLLHAARQEPLGRVLLEAAASGLAVVASSVGGTAEIFDDEQAACLFPINDHRQLVRCLQSLLLDRSMRDKLAARSRQIVESRFDAKRSASDIDHLYREILASRH